MGEDAEVVALTFGRERVPVYNLSVPGSPTYFVGDHGLWVHNCDISKALLDAIKKTREVARGDRIRKLDALMERYPHATPPRRWKKMSGTRPDGNVYHWYEHPKTGRVEGKIAGDPDPF